MYLIFCTTHSYFVTALLKTCFKMIRFIDRIFSLRNFLKKSCLHSRKSKHCFRKEVVLSLLLFKTFDFNCSVKGGLNYSFYNKHQGRGKGFNFFRGESSHTLCIYFVKHLMLYCVNKLIFVLTSIQSK